MRAAAGTSPRGRRTGGREGGTVTAELALVLPAVVMVLLVVLTAAAATVTQVRCADAARAGARAASVGEPAEVVVATARHLAGPEADVSLREEDGWLVVEVSRPVAAHVSWLGGLRAGALARALPEPGT